MSLIPVAPLKSFAGSSFQNFAGLVDLGCETFLIWKGEFVFARQNLIRQSLQRVLSNRVIFLGAQGLGQPADSRPPASNAPERN